MLIAIQTQHKTNLNKTKFHCIESYEHMVDLVLQCSSGPGSGPLQSNIALVLSRNNFLTGLGPCILFSVVFIYFI